MIRTPLRAALRFALSGCLGLATVATLAPLSQAAAEPEKILPDSTLFFFDVKNVADLRDQFGQSQFGQLLADPAIKPLKDSVQDKLNQASKDLKAKLGVTLDELLKLPQGPAHVAIVSKTGGKIPIAVLVCADAGKNEKAMTDVMMKSTKQAEEANAKVGTESYKGLTLHIIQPPKDGDKPNPPLIWTNSGSIFHLATDIEALKDVISHADGRSDALGAVDAFKKSKTKLGTDAPVAWFFDINKAIKLAVRTLQARNGGGGQNFEGILDQIGINGLKSAAGTFSFNSGAFDSVSKVFVNAPAPTTGLLKMFMMPPTNLRPEPWVPATVASYQTLSWELDGAYDALNDLVNAFQPGMLNILEQSISGQNGGEPLSFKKDLFGPLGDRMTLISDFKKPVKEDSQRLLLGVALDDSKAFTNTLTRIFTLTNANPTKRDFQGTTIYDFKLPEMPNAAGGGNNPFKNGTASLAIAKDTLFVSSEPAFLEATLRSGYAPLADSPSFAAVAKQIPAKTSSLTYSRSDEQARVTYDTIKSGQFEDAFKKNPNSPDVSKVIDKDKIPDFSVFAKYLSEGGGFGLMEDDGVTFTNFTLKKSKP